MLFPIQTSRQEIPYSHSSISKLIANAVTGDWRYAPTIRRAKRRRLCAIVINRVAIAALIVCLVSSSTPAAGHTVVAIAKEMATNKKRTNSLILNWHRFRRGRFYKPTR